MSTPKPNIKLKALRESGTANPHPETVKDPAFMEDPFFDPEDLIQVRYEMLRRVMADRHPIATVARNFGVSRPTLYKIQGSFLAKGLEGLLPEKRGPRGGHKLTDEVLQYAEEIMVQNRDLDIGQVQERISHQFGLVVHRRTIERALARLKKKRR